MEINKQRNQAVDTARYVFAFLVVVIHEPCIGGFYMMPLARCAVPFFFMVTGYYLYFENEQRSDRCKRFYKSARKWMFLWFKYTVITYAVLVIMKLFLQQDISWTLTDLGHFFTHGVCRATDVVYWQGKEHGISTLWFLYLGSIFLFIKTYLYQFKNLNKKLIIVAIISLYIICIVLDYFNHKRISWIFLYSTIPSMAGGYIFHEFQRYIDKKINIDLLWLIVAFMLIALYVEYVLVHKYINFDAEMYFMTIPFTMSLFYLLLRLPNSSMTKWFTSHFPVTITLDIYIWHRLVGLFLVMLGFKYLSMYAPLCYIIIFSLSFWIRKVYTNSIKYMRR